MRIILIIILFSLPYCCFSQFKDDFSDVDSFKKNKWEGDTKHFVIDSKGMLRLSNPGQTDISYLSAPFQYASHSSWECEVILDFNPSKYNYCRVYLWSDSANLKETLKGYYLLLGGSDDAIALFRQENEQATCLLRLSNALSESFNRFIVRVNQTQTEWTISYKKINETLFNVIGSVPASDIDIPDSGFLGFFCQYTTTYSKNFYFNYICVENQSSGTDIPDDNPEDDKPDTSLPDIPDSLETPDEEEEGTPENPTVNDTILLTDIPAIVDSPDSLKIDSVSFLSEAELRLYFNKNIIIEKAHFLFSDEEYSIVMKPTSRSHIIQGTISPSLQQNKRLFLFYHNILNLQKQLQPAGMIVLEFRSYPDPDIPDADNPVNPDIPDSDIPDIPEDSDKSSNRRKTRFGDLIITEIMANPKGITLIPDAEYIEILNRTSDTIFLEGYFFHYASRVMTFGNYYLEGGERAILCHESKAELFAGKVIPFKTFPTLANTGKLIYLENADEQLLNWVEYSDSWYGNTKKKQGGYSLEIIDERNLYPSYKNWSACSDPRGGTPNEVNSIQANNPDSSYFFLKAHSVSSATNKLYVSFSKPVQIDKNDSIHWFANCQIEETVCSDYPYCRQFELTVSNSDIISNNGMLIFDSIYDISGKNLLKHAPLQFQQTAEAQKEDFCINEYLFNVSQNNTQFIELFNHSGKTIDLSELSLTLISNDSVISSTFPLSSLCNWWEDNTYAVITPDIAPLIEQYGYYGEPQLIIMEALRSFPPFAGQFALTLSKKNNQIAEQVIYLDSRHTLAGSNQDISFERHDCAYSSLLPANWSSGNTTTGYATPGYKNFTDSQINWADTLTEKSSYASFRLASRRLRLTPDTPESELIIQYELPVSNIYANFELFDDQGHSICKLSTNEELQQYGQLNWGRDWKTSRVSFPGIFVLLVEYHNNEGFNKTQKIVIPVTF